MIENYLYADALSILGDSVNLSCETCQVDFKRYQFQKYCSRKCMIEGASYKENRSKAISAAMLKCYAEGKRDSMKDTEKAHDVVKKKSIEKFKTNPTKYIGKRGYWIIQVPGQGQMKLHHYVWEQVNGKVPKGMVLHHINFDRLDNRIENLRLMGNSEHAKFHWAKRITDKYGRLTPKEMVP